MYKQLKYAFRTVAFSITIILSLMVLLAALLKTGTVSVFIKNQIEKVFSRELNGRLSIWKLDIDLPTGISFYQTKLFIADERLPAVTLDTLSLRLSYASFSKDGEQRIVIPQLYISGLNVWATQNDSGQVNFAQLVRPSDAEPDSLGKEASTSHWPKLDFGQVEIRNAAFQLRRSNETWTIRDFAWRSTLEIGPHFINGLLDEVHFYVKETDFRLTKGFGSFMFNDEKAHLLAFELATPHSSLTFTTMFNGLSIFAPISLENFGQRRVFLEILGAHLDKRDLKKFLPNQPLSKTNWDFFVKASGNLQQLDVETAQVRTDSSYISLSGKLRNWSSLSSLHADLDLQNSTLSFSEVQSLSGLEAFKSAVGLETVQLSGKYRGGMRQAEAVLQLGSRAGNVSLDGRFFYEEEQLNYDASFSVERLDLSKVIGKQSVKSRLNITGLCSGNGLSFQTMQSQFRGQIDTSFIAGRRIGHLLLDVAFNQKLVKGSLTLNSDGQKIAAIGEVDFRGKQPIYRANGTLKSFDLSSILLDSSFSSDLNLTYQLSGDGWNLEDFSTQFSAAFDSSSVRDFQIAQGKRLSFSLNQNSAVSNVELKSQILDFRARGDFDLSRLQVIGERQVAAIIREVQQNNIFNKKQPDEQWIKLPFSNEEISEDSLTVLPKLSLEYELNLKNVNRLAALLKLGDLEVIGLLRGKLESAEKGLRAQAELKIESARLNDTYAALDFAAAILYTDSLLHATNPFLNRFASEVQLSAKKLKVGGNIFLGMDMVAEYREREQYINFRTSNANTQGLIDLNAKIALDEAKHYKIDIQNLSFATEDYFWGLSPGAKIELSQKAVRFENVFLENADQQIRLDGLLELSGSGKIALAIEKLELADFRRFVFSDPDKRFQGQINLDLNIEGSLNDPLIALQLWGDDLAYEKIDLGHIQLQGAYFSELLNFELTANNDSARYDSLGLPKLPYNHISAQGILPIDLRFSTETNRLREDKALSATLRCDDVSPSVIEFLLPFFSNVQGKIPLVAKLQGFFPNPELSMETNLTNLKATAAASEVSYLFNGKVTVSPSKVEWENLTIKDYYGGSGATSGAVYMDNFSVRDISITGNCDELRLFDRDDAGGEDPFGEITASSDNLRFYGTLNAPILEGSLELDVTQYTMFKSGASSKAKLAEAGKFITYTAREDTSLEARLKRDQSLNKTLSLFLEVSQTQKQPTFQESFLDKLRISNFSVKNKRPITYTVIFDRYSGERLLTEIDDMNLTIQKRAQNYTARGSVSISSGKYDFATTSFNIRSGGSLTWNNEDLKNATMENLYADKDVRINDKELNEVDDVRLSLYIGGSLANPQVEMGYWLNDVSQPYSAESQFGDESSNIDPNAQLNVLTMLFARQWYIKPGSSTAIGGNSAITSIGLSTGVGLISTQLSRLATGIPGLRSVNINIASDAEGTPTGVDLSIALTVPGTDGRLKLITSGSTAKSTLAAAEDAGYYTNAQRLEYQLTDNVIVEAYRSFGVNRNSFSYGIGDQVLEVWGMSISYREEFRTWNQLWRRIFGDEEQQRAVKEKKKIEQNPPDKKSAVDASQPKNLER